MHHLIFLSHAAVAQLGTAQVLKQPVTLSWRARCGIRSPSLAQPHEIVTGDETTCVRKGFPVQIWAAAFYFSYL